MNSVALWPLLAHYVPTLSLPGYFQVPMCAVYIGLFFAGHALHRYLPECRIIPGSEHANAFWLRTPAHISTQQLTWRAAHTGVLIEPGARHFLDITPPDNFFRMGFHAIHPDAIAPGVDVLRHQLAQMG